jgi:hypothetical protein
MNPSNPEGDQQMTRRPAHRFGVVCLLGTIAIAGCAPRAHAAASPASTAAATTSSPAPTPAPSADVAVNQRLANIDNEIDTIDGQLNSANAGLSSSEGNPAQ